MSPGRFLARTGLHGSGEASRVVRSGMSPHGWLEGLPSALRHELSLWQLIETRPAPGPAFGGLESQLGMSTAIHGLIEPDRTKAHLCQRVRPTVLTGRFLEVTAVEQVALVALQSLAVGRK